MNKGLLFVLCGLVSICSFGCVSRTKATLGPVSFGGFTEAHEYRDPSLTLSKNGVSATLGWVSAGVNGEVNECKRFASFETITGETSAVNETNIAVFGN